ncbi:MAG TPA: hypothetical protein VLE53_09740 [Gemmatimonadaceae bacterium]|nr:hypothetical protein [Gemmatimonadaceae bacterium]
MSGLTETNETAITRGPRFGVLWAAGVYIVAAMSLGYPALAGGFLVNPRSDQFIAGFAFREFAAASLRDGGGFPLWNPYLFGGLPYVAAMHGDSFYPTFLLRMVLPTDVAMTWGFIIHVVLAGLFTFVFLRALGLGFLAALTGGLAYMLSGNIAGLVSPGHDGKLFMSALLPLALFLVLRGVRDGRPWAWGGLAFTIGLAVLTPHPQLLQYLLLTCGAFGLFLAFSDAGKGRLARPVALRRLALSALAVIVGGAMGAIQFLPVREYVAWSPRAGGKGWEAATSYSMPPEEMVNFYLPQFSGILDAYWGDNAIHLHSEYLGAAVLILVALAFTRSWAAPQRRMLWFWTAALVISLLWALGGYTPFYRLVYAIVPGTKFFRAPSTMLFVVSFCVAMLAAFGAERALRRDISRRFLLISAAVIGLLGLVGVTGGLSNFAASVAEGTPVQGAVDRAMANDGAIRVGALRSMLFAALMLTGLFLVATRRLSREVGGMLLAGTVTVDLWSIERLYWQFSPPASEIYAADATIEYIQNQPQPGRVITFLTTRAAVRDPFITGDALMTHRIRQVTGYHGNELGRYQQLGGGPPNWENTLNPNFWHLMNVRYVLTEAEDLGVPSLRRVVGPVRNAYGTMVNLFESSDENPAAWVTPVIAKFPDDQVLNAILDPRFDVRRAALFDTAAAVTGQDIQALPEPLAIRATIARYEPGAIDVELDQPAPAGSALMVSENYYPGWRATVDDAPAVIGRAHMTLIGVELREGARRISLRFSSQPYETGKTITLVALVIALLAWGGGALLEWRRHA